MPAGSAPLPTVQVRLPEPPMVESCWLYMLVTDAAGSDVVVMLRGDEPPIPIWNCLVATRPLPSKQLALKVNGLPTDEIGVPESTPVPPLIESPAGIAPESDHP